MAKRTLESFYKPISKAKKPRVEDTPPSTYSHHPSYPFPIADLPPSIANALPDLPATTPRSITNQPHLDLLYYQPFISSTTARELFHFLRRELPFYRVQYTIRRGPTTTQITTPRFTTVFGVDDTSIFTPSPNTSTSHLVDSKSRTPIPPTKYKSTPRPIPPCLDALRQRVEAATDGAVYNFCLVNYYATGDDSISYHSDDERFLGPKPCIASLSLGAKRDFLMKHKAAEGVEAAPVKMALADGDMVVMRGETQANWLHSIPKRRGSRDLSGDERAVSMASSLPIYSLQDVSRHNTSKDLWIVIDKEVFDVTEFQAEHPGGERSELSTDIARKQSDKTVLQKVAGKDATDKFLQYHDASILSRYRERLQVGVLVETKAQEPKKGFLSRFFRS
ncbi:alpha-ketoglutarate-dependent dioxygenase alkB homolog 2 [Aspergillus lentulus]|uniref:Alpha-ketoglutarate-dependent dioxygenase alkB homolog 2 n=1 Tax=Aspergillus lentulus TaxID=293939 RepID=A0AAN4PN78_ASPLE|nr:alpha-ketoglutarate-dependent dioxygenase alkB homolog 2 [Aspergillus lentulus]